MNHRPENSFLIIWLAAVEELILFCCYSLMSSHWEDLRLLKSSAFAAPASLTDNNTPPIVAKQWMDTLGLASLWNRVQCNCLSPTGTIHQSCNDFALVFMSSVRSLLPRHQSYGNVSHVRLTTSGNFTSFPPHYERMVYHNLRCISIDVRIPFTLLSGQGIERKTPTKIWACSPSQLDAFYQLSSNLCIN